MRTSDLLSISLCLLNAFRRCLSRFKDTDLSNEDVSRALSASMHFRLRILRYLRTRGKFSLYTLNAALGALGGLTPLGMAAYLARLDFVKVLYEGGLAGVGEGVPGSEKVDGDSDGAVLVDGLDVHRATPIMCMCLAIV